MKPLPGITQHSVPCWCKRKIERAYKNKEMVYEWDQLYISLWSWAGTWWHIPCSHFDLLAVYLFWWIPTVFLGIWGSSQKIKNLIHVSQWLQAIKRNSEHNIFRNPSLLTSYGGGTLDLWLANIIGSKAQQWTLVLQKCIKVCILESKWNHTHFPYPVCDLWI